MRLSICFSPLPPGPAASETFYCFQPCSGLTFFLTRSPRERLPFLMKACLKVRAESFELSKTDSLPNFTHHVKVKVKIVMGVQDRRQKFSRGIKMPQVCTRVSPANRATAVFVDRARIARIL